MVTGIILGIAGSAFATVAVEAEVIRKKVGIQALGNAQIDTAQSKFGGSSALFDGTNDYLTTSLTYSQADDFTIEGWVRFNALPSTIHMFASDDDSSSQYVGVQNSSGTYLLIGAVNEGGANFYRNMTIPSTPSTGVWYHWAMVKSGSTLEFFWDGTLLTTQHSVAGTMTSGKGWDSVGRIGRWAGVADYTPNGWLDEVRFSSTARYTSGFTPSTTPFVNDDDTKLLLHCDGTDASTRFDDDNGVGRSAVGVVGNGAIAIDTAQSYFGGSACLAPGSADSLLFDGSLIPLSGDFTIESWVRFTGTASRKMLYSQYTTGTGRTSLEIGTDEKASFFCASQSSFIEADRILGDSALSVNTWYHIAVVRDGSNFTMYIDGVAQADTITHSVNVQDQDFEIFGDDFGTHTDDVWQDEFRVSDTVRYTANFTAPTAPFVNDSNTLLLLHMDGSDGSTLFLDDNGTQGRGNAVVVTAVNQAQIDTAQYKFGGASALFDGTGDYLNTNAKIPLTGNFTLEYWIRQTSFAVNRAHFQQYTASTDGRTVCYTQQTTGNVFFTIIDNGATETVSITSSTALSLSTWTHIAIVRNGSTTTMYLDGSNVGSDTGNQAVQDKELQIGIAGGASNAFSHIDEFRISNTARYTAAFTPSTEPFTNDANTLMLLHMNGADGSTTFLDDCGRQKVGFTRGSGAQIATADSKFGGSSWFVDNNGTEYLEIDKASFAKFNTAKGDFTVEGWFKPGLPGASEQGNSRFFYFGGAVNGANSFGCAITTGGIIFRGPSQGDLAFNQSNSDWKHYAFVYENGVKSIYYDGSRVATASANLNVTDSTDVVIGGKLTDARFNYYGYIDDFRVSNVARYSGTSYTVPTEPFQNDANTLTLLHFDGNNNSTDFVDDNGKEST